jgi:dTDP-4-amino-4,6-dideoxygalactose transaminase
LRRPIVPDDREHNAHMYYLLLPDLETRTMLIDALRTKLVHSVFHYVPLHSSPHGSKVGRVATPLDVTESASERVLRLPLWLGVESEQDRVIDAVLSALD